MVHGLSCSVAMWDLPGPGLEPMSPELAHGFLTTAPPGKPGSWNFKMLALEKRLWFLAAMFTNPYLICNVL